MVQAWFAWYIRRKPDLHLGYALQDSSCIMRESAGAKLVNPRWNLTAIEKIQAFNSEGGNDKKNYQLTPMKCSYNSPLKPI